ncbi:MAG: hypothetical protein P0S95_07725 [Rhabdochlamydiaceae bacterium]|nr:hypothetical protein [Candidatus Amphrikana amoebophyrae]
MYSHQQKPKRFTPFLMVTFSLVMLAGCSGENLAQLKDNIIGKPIERLKSNYAFDMEILLLQEIRRTPINFYKEGGLEKVLKMTLLTHKCEALYLGAVAYAKWDSSKPMTKQLIKELNTAYTGLEEGGMKNQFKIEVASLMYLVSPQQSEILMREFEQSLKTLPTKMRSAYLIDMASHYLKLPRDISKSKKLINQAEKTIAFVSNPKTQARLSKRLEKLKDEFSHLLID